MQKLRGLPTAAVTLAAVAGIVLALRSMGGQYDQRIQMNLNITTWQTLYAQPWRILTSSFLHQNPLHYMENTIFLLLFGWQLEHRYGWQVFLGVFFGALVTGYVVWINVAHNWIIGLSGGVCGLFGFSLIANRRKPWWTTLTHHPLHVLYALNLLWGVVVDFNNWVPFEVAHLNHLAGILYGMAFGGAFLLTRIKARWLVAALSVALFASQVYSPWQVEWRLIKRTPTLKTETADCQTKSPSQETYIPASISFMNASSRDVAVYWLDYEGDPIFYIWLSAGDSKAYNSFIGHPWCFVDVNNGAALEAATVTESGQIITFQE